MTLSACMIVKNEEHNLPRCLNSIKDWVDEIVVVDTGSEDNTVEIATEYGAKIFYQAWEGNFSKHRNYAMAQATGDWLLTVDADNEFDPIPDKEVVRELLDKTPEKVNAYLIVLHQCTQEGDLQTLYPQVRLFRNIEAVHYEGKIHNQPIVPGRKLPTNLVVKHYGFDESPERMQEKFERTSTRLEEWAEASPEDPKPWFYLANLYGVNGQHDLSKQFADRTLKMIPTFPDGSVEDYLYTMYYTLAKGYLDDQQIATAQAIAAMGEQALPMDPDLQYILFAVGLYRNDENMIVDHGVKYLQRRKTYMSVGQYRVNRFIYTMTEDCLSLVRDTLDKIQELRKGANEDTAA